MVFDSIRRRARRVTRKGHGSRMARIAAAVVMAGAVLGSAVSTEAANSFGGIEGIPRLTHVFVIVLENESYSSTWGPTSPARYLNSLRSRGVLETNYYGAGHVSNDNYISMTSGQSPTPATMSDCVNWKACVQAVSTPANGGGVSIADQLEAKGLSWKGYMEDMPAPCTHASLTDLLDPYQGDSTKAPGYNYADRHNPFIYYAPIVNVPARCAAHVVPYSQLKTALAESTVAQAAVPNFAFIVPNTCHDGHDSPCANGQPGGLIAADNWLKVNLPPIISYVNVTRHNSLLVITFDEGANSDTSGCCGAGPGGTPGFGGKVGLLAISPHLIAGTLLVTPYDHPSLLRTIEDAFGISTHLNNAGSPNEHAMSDLFAR